MNVGVLVATVLAIGLLGFLTGRKRSLIVAEGQINRLHSLPGYYGQAVSFFAIVPAMAIIALWLLIQPFVIENRAFELIDQSTVEDTTERSLIMGDIRRVSEGIDRLVDTGTLAEGELDILSTEQTDIRELLGTVGVALGSDVRQDVLEAAKTHRKLQSRGLMMLSGLALAASIIGFALTYRRIEPEFRARNISETATLAVLIISASIAILTTIGIVLSLVFETSNFFRVYPARDFFLSLTWNPQFRGGSDLGIIPLLWGTLYVSFVALLLAVPVGLLGAIYLAEYASPRMRSIAKPMIELLAGIPTIVYGLFALITVGPLLRDYFAEPLNLGTSSSSVMTAGLVMGIMLIPFVSSLSDDVINAVPQSMRDGSYGLGATQSETIRQVILPAALPGIVGSILLAASRAIGETMIVVMGAGAAAKLDLNPFEAMTTITVKIVSQLTGDTEFASPETLVAFALGLSLFVITLGLNIIALYVVRKYREQYE